MIVIFNTSCLKKGEEDPFISFHSRKARVVGAWKVTFRKYIDSDPNQGFSNIFSDGSYTYDNGITTTTGPQSIEYHFNKDGSFKLTSVKNGITTITEGNWDFMSGVGESKRSAQIALLSKVTANSTSTFQLSQSIIYDLIELRNKNMHWYSLDYQWGSNGSTHSIETETVLEIK